jgi:PRTRC genetic system ThiF family protein
VTFVDPDVVEQKNVFRQNFCDAEVGRYKAETLMQRFSAAWGIPITAITAPFDFETHLRADRGLTALIGCVDNAAARQALHQALREYGNTADVWWLDCGNGFTDGQVVLGSARTLARLASAFRVPTVCAQLPSPALVHPNLLVVKAEELGDAELSCEEILARNAQSLTVNQQVAAVAGHYLVELLLTGTLKRFATYFDLQSGSMRSNYITPEAVAKAVGQTPENLFVTSASGRENDDEAADDNETEHSDAEDYGVDRENDLEGTGGEETGD